MFFNKRFVYLYVYVLRKTLAEGWELGSQPRGIRDHKPWDRDQQCLKGSGCTIFLGSRTDIYGTEIGSAMK